MLPHEEEALVQLLAEILAAGSVSRDTMLSTMTLVISEAYAAGLKTLDTAIDVDPHLTENSIARAAKSMSARTGQIWDQMDQQISDTILSAIKSGKSYDDTMDEVTRLITSDWGETVDFDNVGNTNMVVRVNPDGSMKWEKHEVRRKSHFSTDAYADNISRTVVHESWNAAHHDQQQSIGLTAWVYHAVNDAATRPTHLALHGKVIQYGSAEDEMARAVMQEPNCRCRAGPYWDDPEFDTAPEVYDRQAVRAAKESRETVADDSDDAAFLDITITTRKPFIDAVNHAELRQMMSAKWRNDIHVAQDFEETELETMKTTLSAIDRVARDFSGSRENIGLIMHKSIPGAFAYCQHSVGYKKVPRSPVVGISFPGNYYYSGNTTSLISELTLNKNAKWLVSSEVGATAAHEFGHAIEVALAYRAGKSLTSHASQLISRAAKNLLGRPATPTEKKELRRAISKYAATKPPETVAESIADVYYNGVNAAPLSKEIVALLRAEWKLS
ncbi:MAG TPA: phage minor head protein [Methanocorpusculum sp.]|nr:phage minor head protein [Methanocorpusculum sp.]